MQVYTCIVSICKRIVKRVYLSTLRRLIIKLEFVNFTVQEIAAMLLLNPYSDKNIPSESAHRIVGIRAVVKSEHGIIAPFTEQRSALAADIIRRSDPA